uniref:Uncharacterized protein n=1 Tax=Cacopsylla melanoneura TaxID=428564 RepID=A0A8D8V412_9HEMI
MRNFRHLCIKLSSVGLSTGSRNILYLTALITPSFKTRSSFILPLRGSHFFRGLTLILSIYFLLIFFSLCPRTDNSRRNSLLFVSCSFFSHDSKYPSFFRPSFIKNISFLFLKLKKIHLEMLNLLFWIYFQQSVVE